MGWVRRPWARLGRNATLVFLLQITGCVLGAIGVGTWNAVNPPRSTADELFPIVVVASANLATGVLLAMPLLWIWVGRRADRLSLAPPRGEAPGLWRFAVYAASLVFWPLGVLLAVIFNAPENARVGANAFRCSLLQLVGIALAVCVALPLCRGGDPLAVRAVPERAYKKQKCALGCDGRAPEATTPAATPSAARPLARSSAGSRREHGRRADSG